MSLALFPDKISYPEPLLESNHLKKQDLRYIDPVASLVGLAEIAMMQNQQPKLSLGLGRFFPKTEENAAKAWTPHFLRAKAMPSIVRSAMFSLDRSWNGDSREHLVFYNHAIPYMHKLYPTDSEDVKQNAIMKRFWRHVEVGITKLEKSYAKELDNPLIAQEHIEPHPTKLALKLEESINKTFRTWYRAIEEYLELEPNPKKDFTYDDLQIPSQQEFKSKKNKRLNSLLSLHSIFSSFKNKLSLLTANSEKKTRVLKEMQLVVEMTLKDESVPEKLHPLSNKVKVLWTLENIETICSSLENDKTAYNEKKLASFEATHQLDEKAQKYMLLVDEAVDEIITL